MIPRSSQPITAPSVPSVPQSSPANSPAATGPSSASKPGKSSTPSPSPATNRPSPSSTTSLPSSNSPLPKPPRRLNTYTPQPPLSGWSHPDFISLFQRCAHDLSVPSMEHFTP